MPHAAFCYRTELAGSHVNVPVRCSFYLAACCSSAGFLWSDSAQHWLWPLSLLLCLAGGSNLAGKGPAQIWCTKDKDQASARAFLTTIHLFLIYKSAGLVQSGKWSKDWNEDPGMLPRITLRSHWSHMSSWTQCGNYCMKCTILRSPHSPGDLIAARSCSKTSTDSKIACFRRIDWIFSPYYKGSNYFLRMLCFSIPNQMQASRVSTLSSHLQEQLYCQLNKTNTECSIFLPVAKLLFF